MNGQVEGERGGENEVKIEFAFFLCVPFSEIGHLLGDDHFHTVDGAIEGEGAFVEVVEGNGGAKISADGA